MPLFLNPENPKEYRIELDELQWPELPLPGQPEGEETNHIEGAEEEHSADEPPRKDLFSQSMFVLFTLIGLPLAGLGIYAFATAGGPGSPGRGGNIAMGLMTLFAGVVMILIARYYLRKARRSAAQAEKKDDQS